MKIFTKSKYTDYFIKIRKMGNRAKLWSDVTKGNLGLNDYTEKCCGMGGCKRNVGGGMGIQNAIIGDSERSRWVKTHVGLHTHT